MDVRKHLTSLSLAVIKELVKKHNLHYSIKLTQPKGVLVDALVKQYEKIADNKLVHKTPESLELPAKPQRPKKQLADILNKYVEKNKNKEQPFNKTYFYSKYIDLLKSLNKHRQDNSKLTFSTIASLRSFFKSINSSITTRTRDLTDNTKTIDGTTVPLTLQDRKQLIKQIELYNDLFESIADRMPTSALEDRLVEQYYGNASDSLEIANEIKMPKKDTILLKATPALKEKVRLYREAKAKKQ